MPLARSPATLSALVVAALGIAGCGEEDGQEAEDIGQVVAESVRSDDPASCTELATPRFIEQTQFATGRRATAACRRETGDPSDDPGSVEVSDVEVDGDRATADVAFEGSVFDGSVVTVALVREEERWKLDRLEDIPEFDRQAFEEAFVEQAQHSGELNARQGDCVIEQFGGLSDDDMKELLLSGDKARLASVLKPCG